MCVIIHRSPNITIPFEKLESACIVNSDGMGIVTFDRGKIEMRKFFDAAGNDPDVLARHLEQAKDLDVYVHLRYRTKGSTDKANVHPFGVLTSKKHGFDLQFMHNGTLSDFGTETDCDSKHFAKTFLTPFSEKLLKAIDPELLIHDPVFKMTLQSFAGKGSVFLLADSFGNHQIINYDNGKEFDGWWASNEYSFNNRYRSYGTTGTYCRNGKKVDYRNSFQDENKPNWGKYSSDSWDNDKEKKVVTLSAVPASGSTAGTAAFNDEVPWKGDETKKVKEVAKSATVSPTLPRRLLFIEAAEIESLSEVCSLTRLHIEDLVEEHPEHAVLLILDLLKELYDREHEQDDAYGAEKAA